MDGIPHEVIVHILEYLNEPDRISVSLVNRRFRDAYRFGRKQNFVFHLQGTTENLLKEGIRVLFKTDIPLDRLKVSKFDLKAFFDEKISLSSHPPIESVTSLWIKECIFTDNFLLQVRRLFPNMSRMRLERSFFVYSNDRTFTTLPINETFKPIKQLYLTYPLYDICFAKKPEIEYNSDSDEPDHIEPSSDSLLEWIIDYCVLIDKLHIETSTICYRRPIVKRFCRLYLDKHTCPEWINREPPNLWISAINKKRSQVRSSNIRRIS